MTTLGDASTGCCDGSRGAAWSAQTPLSSGRPGWSTCRGASPLGVLLERNGAGEGGGGREKRERKEKASLVGGTCFEYVY